MPGNEYEKYIDFSASIVPEMPERIKKAAVRAMEEARRYPEPGNQSLKEAIAKKNGLDPENIVCGNGAAELIYRVAQCFAQQKGASERKEALIIEPAFTEYERALSQNGIKVRHYVSTHEGFALTEAFLSELSGETYKNTGVIFIAQPANPTGILTKEGLLTRLAVLCEEKGILLVVDESFYELTEKGKTLWLGPDRRMDRNRAVKREGLKELLILNSFTKLYGMAGLRLGYLIGYDKKLLQKIDSIGQPWPISAPSGEKACR